MALLFMISAVAECNRCPMDLPEAESELVSGFMTEHSAIGFTFFFLGEYTNILTISTLFFILFLPIPNLLPLAGLPLIFFMFWLRASLARLRFDQLLKMGWSHILPFTIGYVMWLPCFLYTFDIFA